jgi:hypothetical protein
VADAEEEEVVEDVAAAAAEVVAAAAFPEAAAVVSRGPAEGISPEVVRVALLVREAVVLAQGISRTPDAVTAVSLLRGTPVPVTEPRVSD